MLANATFFHNGMLFSIKICFKTLKNNYKQALIELAINLAWVMCSMTDVMADKILTIDKHLAEHHFIYD